MSWEKFGSPSSDFCGAIFFAGLFAGYFAGLSPASFNLKGSPKGSKLEGLFLSAYDQQEAGPMAI